MLFSVNTNDIFESKTSGIVRSLFAEYGALRRRRRREDLEYVAKKLQKRRNQGERWGTE